MISNNEPTKTMNTNKELSFEIRDGRLYVGYEFGRCPILGTHACLEAVEAGAECLSAALRSIAGGGDHSILIRPDAGRSAVDGLKEMVVSVYAQKDAMAAGEDDLEAIQGDAEVGRVAADCGDVRNAQEDGGTLGSEGAGGDESGIFHG
jgi:hypothetical protein